MKAPGPAQLPAIARLLAEADLPTDDLDEQDLRLFRLVGSGESIDAVGGLERCGDRALIRSVATSPAQRGRGLAREVVAELEALAKTKGIAELYLLTETAERFFEALGYSTVDRAAVPSIVRATRQFSSLCPDSATVMRKILGA